LNHFLLSILLPNCGDHKINPAIFKKGLFINKLKIIEAEYECAYINNG